MTKDEQQEVLYILGLLMTANLHQGCWCQFGLGNPMFTFHSNACNTIKRYYKRIEDDLKEGKE